MFTFNRLLYQLMPGCCVLCGLSSNRQLDLCSVCQQALEQNTTYCQCCALPLKHQGTCGECINKSPSFSHVIAPWLYTPPVSSLAKSFKNSGNTNAASILLKGLFTEIESQQNVPDALMPVPLFWKKRVHRGFNQAHWLGKQVSKHLGIPLLDKLLYKNRATSPQRQLKKVDRQKNLLGCFSVQYPLEGEYIALIDDVMTTGSTAEEAAKTLIKAGASRVDVWCLARTPLEN